MAPRWVTGAGAIAGSSVAENRHVHLIQARRFGDHLDCHDLAGCDREAEDDAWPPAGCPDEPHRSIDERRFRGSRPPGEGLGQRYRSWLAGGQFGMSWMVSIDKAK